jgi:hypothetical protein
MPFLAFLAAPAAIAAIGGVGVGLTVLGQVQAGRQAEAQGESQQALAEYNAQLAEREAEEAQEAAATEERKLRKAGVRLKAIQRARFGAIGVTPEGSPLDVMAATAAELKRDALTIRRGGQLGFQRFTAEASLQRIAGKSALLRGRSRRRASYLGAGATALTDGVVLWRDYKDG